LTAKESNMDAEKLSINLPGDVAKMIRSQVESGASASHSELIGDALRLWQERVGRLETIRAKLDEAADDPEEISAEDMREYFERRSAMAGK
jgi:antitoxin ParD1/3/4